MGHQVVAINPGDFIPGHGRFSLFDSFHVRSGFRLVAPTVASRLRTKLNREIWDLAWIDCGAELSPSFYHWLREREKPVVNYITDNPFQKRDHRKWDLYCKSVHLHDLTVVPRLENVNQALKAGAAHVMRVHFSYDPIAHASTIGPDIPKQHDVIFVGSWMPERGPFAMDVISSGLPLKIIGDGWPRSPEWKYLRNHWLGGSVYGRAYVQAIESSRIAIGLLSKGNCDQHTTRSVEIPFIGSAAFCGERTPEHLAMYDEGDEALFWSNAEECVEKCRMLLGDTEGLRIMVENAKNKVIKLKLSNDEVMTAILNQVKGS